MPKRASFILCDKSLLAWLMLKHILGFRTVDSSKRNQILYNFKDMIVNLDAIAKIRGQERSFTLYTALSFISIYYLLGTHWTYGFYLSQ